MARFRSHPGCKAFPKAQLQSQFNGLKAKYKTFQACIDNSGFGWNDELKIPIAPDSVWDAYIKAHPEAKEFRNSTLKFYDKLHEICPGVIATGKVASTAEMAKITHSAAMSDTPIKMDDDDVDTSHEPSESQSTTPQSFDTIFGGKRKQTSLPDNYRKTSVKKSAASILAEGLLAFAQASEYDVCAEAASYFEVHFKEGLTVRECMAFKDHRYSDILIAKKFFSSYNHSEKELYIHDVMSQRLQNPSFSSLQ